jgi:predicted RNA-binding protein with PIN domain
MPYLIDGHNLIGVFPGLSLADPEDERHLVEILSRYATKKRRRMIVFFDAGQVGGGMPHRGNLEMRFIVPPRTADDAILDFLRRERNPRAYTAVTSDARLGAAIRGLGARLIDSRTFSRSVQTTLSLGTKGSDSTSTDDLDEWLTLFGEGR